VVEHLELLEGVLLEQCQQKEEELVEVEEVSLEPEGAEEEEEDNNIIKN
jgi:hypothetical protein